jgi:hypothetical protein
MTASRRHPAATAICTKFIVRRDKRRGPAAMKMIAAIVRFGIRHGVKECYIDCIPSLIHYYRALGFTVTGEQFFHRENGPSFPMMIDVERHGRRLSSEFTSTGYLRLYAAAQAFKWWDRVRSAAARPARRGSA